MSLTSFLDRLKKRLLTRRSLPARRPGKLRVRKLEDRKLLDASFAFNGIDMLDLTDFDAVGGTTEVNISQDGNTILFDLEGGAGAGGTWSPVGAVAAGVAIDVADNSILRVDRAAFEDAGDVLNIQLTNNANIALDVNLTNSVNLPDSPTPGSLTIDVDGSVNIQDGFDTLGSDLNITAEGVTSLATIDTGVGDLTIDGGAGDIALQDISANSLTLTTSGSVNVADNIDVTTDIDVDAGTNATFDGTIDAAGSVTIAAETAVSLNGSVGASTAPADLDITTRSLDLDTVSLADGADAVWIADNIDIGGNVTPGTGSTLTIAPKTASQEINIGTVAISDFHLSDTEINRIDNGFDLITIGDAAAGTGAVTIESVVIDDSVSFVGGSIAVSDLSAGTNNVSITARTGSIQETGDIVTNGGDLILRTTSANAAVISAAGSDISTTGGGAAGAAVTIIADNLDLGGDINSGDGLVTLRPQTTTRIIRVGSAIANTLSITDAELDRISTSGGLTIGGTVHTGNIATTGEVSPANLTGGTLLFQTGGSGTVSVLGAGNVISQVATTFDTDTADIILSGGTVSTANQDITFAGNVRLDASASISSGIGAGDVSFAGTVNAGDSTGSDRFLLVNAGSGTVQFASTIGNAANGQLADLDITAALTRFSAGIVQLDDNDASNATATITGDIQLDGNVVFDLDRSSGTDNSLIVTGNINADSAASNRTLQITAGSGDVIVDGAIGVTESLVTIDVTSANNVTFENTLHTTGSVNLTNTGSATTNGGSIGGDLDIESGNVAFASGTLTVSGDADVTASGSITGGTDDNTADLTGTNITLDAGAAGIGSSLERLDLFASAQLNAVTSAANASFFIDAIGALNVGSIDAGTGTVAVSATASIVDALSTENANITAGSVALRASMGIGDGVATDTSDIDLAVGTVAALTESGDINLQNTGVLNINSVDGLSGISISDSAEDDSGHDDISIVGSATLQVSREITNADGGDVELTANNSLSVFNNVQVTDTATSGADGHVILTASDNDINHTAGTVSTVGGSAVAGDGGIRYAAGDGVNIDGSADAQTESGALEVIADTWITVGSGSEISASTGQVVVQVDADGAADASGGSISFTGRLVSGTTASFTGNGNNDSFHFAPSANSTAALMINGEGGDDAVTIDISKLTSTVTVTNDSDEGNDSLTIHGTNSDDTLNVDGTGTVFDPDGDAETVNYDGNLETLNINGSSGRDTFNVSPSENTNTTITINGGGPGSSPGDVLHFTLPAGETITPSGSGSPGSGSIETSNHGTVNFTGLEEDIGLVLSGHVIISGTANTDVLEITATDDDSGTFVLTSNGTTGATFAFDDITSMQFDGGDGDDILRINNPATGLFNPAGGITFNGQGQTTGDSLEILDGNTGPAGSVEHRFANDNDGSILYNGTTTIVYTGLEPIVDTIVTADRTFTFLDAAPGGETITLSDDASYAGNAANDDRSVIDSTAGESVVFVNATNAVTIQTEAAGGSGADTINIEGVDAQWDADLTITTGNDDTVNFQSSSTGIGGGNLSVTANTINLNAAITTAGSVSLTASGAITDADADTDITADELELVAATGIGSANAIETIVNTLAFSNTTSGQVNITNTGGLTIGNAGSLTASNSVAGGTIAANSPLTISHSVTVNASMTFTAGNDAGGAGDDLTINNSAVVTLDSVANGTLTFNAGDDILIATDTGAQIVTQGGGVHTVSLQVDLDNDAAEGSVNQTGAANAVTTNSLDIDANNGIGNTAALQVTAATVSADTTNGNIDVDNAAIAAVTATSLTTGTGTINFDQTGSQTLNVNTATTTDGTITITNDDAALIATVVTAGGAGDVVLTTTTDGNINLGAITAAGDTVLVTSAAAITDADSGATETANITAAEAALRAVTGIGNGQGGDDDDIDTTGGAGTFTLAAVTESGDINVRNTGPLTVGLVDSLEGVTITDAVGNDTGADHVTLITTSSLQINRDVVNNDGGDILLVAQGNANADVGTFNSADDDIQVNDQITATGGSGSISLFAGGDIIFTTGPTSTVTSGAINFSAGEDFNDGTNQAGNAAADVTMTDGTLIQSANGQITIESTRHVNLSRIQTGGTVNVSADDNDFGLADGAGAITDSLTGEGNTNENVIASTINMSAASGIGNGTGVLNETVDIDVDAVTLNATNTTSGAIQIFELNNVGIGVLSNGNRAIVLDADGNITDANGSNNNITAANLVVAAAGSIDLDTNVASLAASTSATGDIDIDEANDVTLTDVDTSDGALTIDAAGTISAEDVVGAGTVTLTTIDAASAGQNIVLGAGDVVQSTTGDVLLQSGDDFTIAATATVSAFGSVTLAGDFGDADGGTGTTISSNGVLIASSEITITGEGDDDSISVTPAATSSGDITIDGHAGNDSYAVGLGNLGGTVTIDDQASEGTDDLTVTDASGIAETFAVGPTGIVTTTVGETVSFGTHLEDITLLGDDESDTFNVTASTTAQFHIVGGSPAAPTTPGDAINYLSAGATFTPSGDDGGSFTATGLQDVTFDEIETLNLTGDISINGTAGDDLFEFNASSANSGTLIITSDGTASLVINISSVTSLSVSGLAGDDILRIVNPATSLFDPTNGITFNGGSGGEGNAPGTGDNPTGDALEILSGEANSVEHVFVNDNDGSVFYNGEATATIVYTGLEPVLDTIAATTRTFTFTGGAETITLSDAATAGQMTIDSTLGEAVTFTNPSDQLTINAGTGDDVITIDSVDASFRAALTVNGQDANDTINLNTSLTLGNGTVVGNLELFAETISIDAASINTDDSDGATDGGRILIAGDDSAAPTVAAVELFQSLTIDTEQANGADSDNAGAVDLEFTNISANAAGINLIVNTSATNGDAGAVDLGQLSNQGAGNEFLEDVTLVATGMAGGTVTLHELIELDGTNGSFVVDSFGSIVDGNAADMNIIANDAAFRTSGAVAAAGDPLETTIAALEAEAAAGVFISNTGDITVGGLTLPAPVAAITGISTAANDIELTTNGSITIDEDITASGNMVTLTASTTINGIATVTADNVDLNAETGIGNTAAIQLADVTSLTADSSAGNINIDHVASAALTVNSLTTTSGTISFDQTGDESLTLIDVDTFPGTGSGGDITITNMGGTNADIVVHVVRASIFADTILLTSDGAITDGSGDETANLMANAAGLSAVEGIGDDSAAADDINTSVAEIAAITDSGDINVTELDSLEITTVGSISGLTIRDTADDNTTADTITVVNAGMLTVSDAVTNNDGGSITLTAATGLFSRGDIVVTADVIIDDSDATEDATGNIVITTADTIVISSTITTDDPAAINDAGAITINAAGPVAIDGGSVSTDEGDLTIVGNPSGAYTLATSTSFAGIAIDGGDISSNSGDITLTGRGGSDGTSNNDGIEFSNSSQITTTSGTVTLTGTGGAGSNSEGVEFEDGSSITTDSGDVIIVGNGGTTGDDNSVGVVIDSDAFVESTGVAMITVTGTGNAAGDGVRIGSATTDGSIESVDGAIIVNGTTGTGNAISLLNASTINGSGDASITLNGTGAVFMADGTTVTAANGSLIDVDATADITISAITTVGGEVQVDSTSGEIIDGGDGGGDITAETAALRAATGIGSTGELDVNVATLAGTTSSGSLRIHDIADDIIIGTVDGTAGLTISAGSADDHLVLLVTGSITANEVVSNTGGGNVRIAAEGGGSLTINAAVASIHVAPAANTGDILLTADADIRIDEEVHTSGDGSLRIVSSGDIHVTDSDSSSNGLTAVNGAGDVLLDALGAIQLGDNITSGTGDVGILAAGVFVQQNDVTISTNGGDASIRGASIEMNENSLVDSANGNIVLSTSGGAGDITLERLNAGSTGHVHVRSTGSIIDRAAGESNNITAASANLIAASLIGNHDNANLMPTVNGNAINTSVDILTANAESGIYVRETDGVTIDTALAFTVVATANNLNGDGSNSGSTSLLSDSSTGGQDLTTNDGPIKLVADAGEIIINDGTTQNGLGIAAGAGGDVLLEARAGGITVNSDVQSDGGHITVRSADDIDLNEDVRTGSAAGSTGTLFLSAMNDITIDDGADADTNGLVTDGGAILIRSSNLTTNADVQTNGGDFGVELSGSGGLTGTFATSGGDVLLRTDADLTLDLINAGSGTVQIEAVGNVIDGNGTGANIESAALRIDSSGMIGNSDLPPANSDPMANANAIDITVETLAANAADGIYLLEAGTVTIDTVASIALGVQEVNFNSTDTLVSSAADTSGLADLSTTDGPIKLVVTTGDVTLNDGTAITTPPPANIGTDNGLSISAGGAGDVLIEARNGSIVVSADAAIQSGTGHITLKASGSVDINATVTTSNSGTVLVEAGTSIDSDAALTSVDGDILLNATTAISQTAAINSTGGNIGLVAGTAITQTAAGDVTTATGDVLVDAGTDITMAGDATILADNSTITFGGGDALLIAGGDIIVGILSGTNTDANRIALSAGGSILDANAAVINIEEANAAATTSLSLRATPGIIGGLDAGTPDVNNAAIDLNVDTVAAASATGIYLREIAAGGAIAVHTVEAVSVDVDGVRRVNFRSDDSDASRDNAVGSLEDLTTANNGPIKLVAEAGTVTINGGTLSASDGIFADGDGDVLLEARGTGSDVVINATVESNSGHVTFDADNNVDINATTTITSGDGTLVVLANGNIDIDAALTTANGDVLLNAGLDVAQNAAINSTSGDVGILASNDITQTSAADIATASGDILLDADNNITMDGATEIGFGGQDALLIAGNDIRVGLLSGTNSDFNRIAFVAGNDIIDGNSGTTDAVNVQETNSAAVTSVSFRAAQVTTTGAIGGPDGATGSDFNANAIDLNVDVVAAEAGGGIYLRELAIGGAITIDTAASVQVSVDEVLRADFNSGTTAVGVTENADALEDLATTGGPIKFVAEDGSIVANDGADADGNAVTAGGASDILLEARGSGSDAVVNADVRSGSGNIAIEAGRDVEVNHDLATTGDGTIFVSALTGSLTINDADASNVAVTTSAESILISAATFITLNTNADVVSTSGNIAITAGTSVTQHQSIQTTGGDLLVTASDGSITQSTTSETTTGAATGNILLTASADISLHNISAGTGAISMHAGGSIADTDDTTATDITADGLRMTAGNLIGSAANAIDTSVTALAAASGDGIFVLEANDVRIDNVAATTVTVTANRPTFDSGIVTPETTATLAALADLETNVDGSILLATTNGTITIEDGDSDGDGVVAAEDGNVLLQAGTTGNVIVNADVSSGAGHVTLTAADDVDVNAAISTGTSLTNNGSVYITADNVTNGDAIGPNVDGVNLNGTITTADGDVLVNSAQDIRATQQITTTSDPADVGLIAARDMLQEDDGDIAAGGDVFVEAGRNWTMATDAAITASGGELDGKALAGNVTLGRINSTNTALTAFDSIIDGNAGDLNVVGATLSLRATNGLIGNHDNANGSPTQNVNALDTQVATLAANSESGIYVHEADDLTVDLVAAVNMDVESPMQVNFDNSVSNVAQSQMTSELEDLSTVSNGPIKVQTTDGSLTINGGTDTSGITADGSGDVLLHAIGDFSDVIVNATVASISGNITLNAQDDVDINAEVSTTDDGTIFINADNSTTDAVTPEADGINIDAAVSTVNGDVLISSSKGDIRQTQAITSSTGNVALIASNNVDQLAVGTNDGNVATGGDVLVEAGNNWTMDADATITATGGEVIGAALTGDLNLGLINSTNVALTAGGSILDANAAAMNVNATNLSAQAVNGSVGTNADAIETTIDVLATNAETGIFLQETDDLIIDAVAAITVTQGGVATPAAGDPVRVNFNSTTSPVAETRTSDPLEDLSTDADGDVKVVAGANLTVNGGGDTSAVSANGSGNILLQAAGGNLTVNDDATSGTGHVTLYAADQLNLGAASDTPVVVATRGSGSIVAEAAGSDVVMQPNATLHAEAGSIHVEAATNVIVGRIETDADVAITASGGSISDADADDAMIDINSNGLRLNAATSIGDLAGNGIETQVATLTAQSDGVVHINEADDLIIGTVEVVIQQVVFGGSTTTVTDGAQSGIVTNGEDLLVTTGETLTIDDAINVDTAAVRIVSGATISQTADGPITAGELGIILNSTTPDQNVSLGAADNSLGTIAINNSSEGGDVTVFDADANGVTVGEIAMQLTFDTTTGINANAGDINITSEGTLNVTQDVDAANDAASTSAATPEIAHQDESITLISLSGNFTLADNTTVTTDENPVSGRFLEAEDGDVTGDNITIIAGPNGGAGLVHLGDNVNVRTDAGTAVQIAPRPAVFAAPGSVNSAALVTIGDAAAMRANLTATMNGLLGEISLIFGVAGEENLEVVVDWGVFSQTSPTQFGLAGDAIANGIDSFVFTLADANKSIYNIDQGGAEYLIPHIYSPADLATTSNDRNGRQINPSIIGVRFSVAHHESINIWGNEAVTADGTESTRVNPFTGTADSVVDANGNVVSPAGTSLGLLSSTDTNGLRTGSQEVTTLPPAENVVVTASGRPEGFAEFEFLTGPTPGIVPVKLTEVPKLEIPLIEAPSQTDSTTMIVGDVSFGNGAVGDAAIGTEVYLQIRRYFELDAEAEVVIARITDSTFISNRDSFEAFVAENSELQDGAGYEVWLITETGGQRVERPIVKFEITGGRPGPATEELPETFQPYELRELEFEQPEVEPDESEAAAEQDEDDVSAVMGDPTSEANVAAAKLKSAAAVSPGHESSEPAEQRESDLPGLSTPLIVATAVGRWKRRTAAAKPVATRFKRLLRRMEENEHDQTER